MASRTKLLAPETAGEVVAGAVAPVNIRRRVRPVLMNLLVYLLLIVFGVTMLGPLVWMVTTSLKAFDELYLMPPRVFPAVPQWDNYVHAWGDFAPFDRFFINSTIVALAVTSGEVVTSSLAGYVFARMRWPGRNRLFLLYLGTLMIPSQVLIVPLYVLLRQVGWIDSYYGLIIPALASPFGTFLVRQFMVSLPVELEEAARVDGANHFVIYSRVILPLCRPVLATLAVLTFLSNWNSFLWPLIITSRQEMQTVPIGLAYFAAAQNLDKMLYGQWHLYMAAATFSMLPTLIVFLMAQRHFVRGVVMSGLKG